MSAPWGCPIEGCALEAEVEALSCPDCGARYALRDGIVCLMSSTSFTDATGEPPAPAILDELAHALEQADVADAGRGLAELCQRRSCRRSPHGADWKLLLPVGGGTRVLEIGPGLGDVTADLAARGAAVAVLAAHPAAARLARDHVTWLGHANVAFAAAGGLSRLPCATGAFDAIAADEAGLRGFGPTAADLPRLAAELRRVAAPGATVLLGQSNPLWRVPGTALVLDRLRAARERSLDAVLREALIAGGTPRRGRRAIVRAMRDAGFAGPRIFAPIPDEERAEAILPADDPTVVRYFLDRLVRRNAPATRLALALLRPLVAAGFFPVVVPYWYLVFRAPTAAGEPAGAPPDGSPGVCR